MSFRNNPLENLERTVDDAYLTGIEQLTIEQVRARRKECEEVAEALSLLRRLVQGRLDIVHADLRRRAGGSQGDLAEIVDQLPHILSEGRRTAEVRHRLPRNIAPDINYRLLTADLDRIMDAKASSGLPSMTHDEVRQIADGLEELERKVSEQRHKVHTHGDRLQAEIVRRYKTGEVSADDLLRT